MKIQIDGTGMENKGAALMLHAILIELENRYPDAEVYYNTVKGNINKINTQLDLRHRFFLKHGRYGKSLFKRLGLDDSYFDRFYVQPKLNLVLDGSGFRWGDQWKYDQAYFKKWENYYKGLKKNGAKIILLPQAFGPFNSSNGKQAIDMLNTYADLVIAREQISLHYLMDSGMDPAKTLVCTDFSLTVDPEVSTELETSGKLCIIPNSQMIRHGGVTRDMYIRFLSGVITDSQTAGYEAFLLNHEGPEDLKLCKEIQSGLKLPAQIFSGLDAKQTKGVISTAYAVISSRFHGVASALNQGVPTLATSWSHKYAELFRDFGLDDQIIDVKYGDNITKEKVNNLLDPIANKQMQKHLESRIPLVSREVENMWQRVFLA